jgi:RHS repeat-associated protein
VNYEYLHNLQARDAEFDLLQFGLIAGPAGMTIDPPTGLLRWTPAAAELGDHRVTVKVSDATGSSLQTYTLTVHDLVTVPDVVGQTRAQAQAALAAGNLNEGRVDFTNHLAIPAGSVITQAPVAGSVAEFDADVDLIVSLGAGPADIDDDNDGFSENLGDCDDDNDTVFPGAVDIPGDGIDQDCDGSDATVPPAQILITPATRTVLTDEVVELTATGINADGTSRNLTGVANWSVGPAFSSAAPGVFVVTAIVGGVTGSAQVEVIGRVAGDVAPPVAVITAPLANSTVTEPMDVTGSASDANFLKYELAYAIAGDSNFTTITSSSTAVTAGTLGQFDPTLLINDLYTLRLAVFDKGGNQTIVETTVQVDENMKVGNFTLSFTDLQIPMSGIPITVTRTYDSRDKQTGDFGANWRLDVNTLRLRTNRIPGTGWEVVKSGLAFGLLPTDAHKVSLTLADGRVEEFELVISPTVSPLVPFPPLANRASFQPRPGTLGTLISLDNNNLSILDSQPGVVNLLDDLTNKTYNPQRFKYTAADGTEIVIHKTLGVESVRDPNGNTLSFSVNGIIHSGGKSVLFQRDTEGRITQLTDPGGNVQTYSYDVNGDLTRHTDAENNTTQYAYNGSHGLIRVDDPSGNQAIRNEYDSDGRLLSSTDANSNRIQYVHNPGARQSLIIDQLGGATVYEYDVKGNVLTQTDPLGGVTAYSYDANNNKISETNPLGRSFTFTYDAQNNLLSQSDALGNVAQYTYNALGKRISKTDLMGNVTLSTYSANGENLLSDTDALGNVTRYSYDASGNRLTVTDATGSVTATTYNGSGDRLTETNALGDETTLGYDASGNRTSQVVTRTLADGTTETLTTLFEYDQAGRQVGTTDPNGNAVRVEYDFGGKKIAEVDKNGNRTTFVYDGGGNLLRTVLPGGEQEQFNYDGNGNRITRVDEAGEITRYSYDALDRLVGTVAADGGAIVVAYDATGEITSNTDARGNQTRFSFDVNGRRTRVTDALGHQTAYTYDANGNTLSVTDANGNTTAYAYDALDRRITSTFQDGTSVAISYDRRGNKTAETDQVGATIRYAYDVMNRLVSVTDALGQVVSYAYDETGNRIAETDANGNITRWEYDGAGHLSRVIHPLGTTESYTYDGEGNRTSHKDANGSTTLISYDGRNRLLNTLFPDGSSEDYAYTATGQRASVTTASGATAYSYDNMDRLSSVVNSDGSTLDYSYDVMGNRTSVTTLGGVTRTTFDALNRPLTVTDADAGVTTYDFDPAGNRAALTYPNGATTSYAYDALGRLTSVVNRRSDGSEISTYTYILGPAGNRVQLTESGGRVVDYAYDALYRLTQETITDPTLGNSIISYTYDSHGNRLSKSDTSGTRNYVYDANDRLLSDGINTYSYDANGNTLSKSSGAGSVSYGYDFENQMVSIPSNGMVYSYDADGARVASNINGETTRYVVDKNRQLPQVLEEQDGSGTTLVSYTYGDDLVSQQRAGATRFYMYDGQMSTRLLIDGTEAVTDTYVYDAFGQLLDSSGGTENNYLYAGEQYDPNAGFYYLRSRYYNPDLGRFTSKDDYPADRFDPGTLHRYVYVKNNPVNFVDPTGEFFTLTGIVVAISVDSSLGKAYGKMLGKVLLTSLRFSKCLLEPGAQLRDLGLELVTDPRMGHVGARMVIMGNEMIAEGFGKLRDSLNKIVDEFANSLLPKLEITISISVDVSEEVAKAYQGYQKYQEYKDKINKVTKGLVKMESFLRDLAAGRACDVLAFVDDELNADDD